MHFFQFRKYFPQNNTVLNVCKNHDNKLFLCENLEIVSDIIHSLKEDFKNQSSNLSF